MNITFTRATTRKELLQILSLQKMNLKLAVSEWEMVHEGFVTVEHTYELLERMNSVCAHIIAKDGDNVVGYALSMDPIFKGEIGVLQPMFKELEQRNILNFLVMGQIGIAKFYRKQGIFRGLYTAMQEEYHLQYNHIITEVDAMNKRSLAAHLAVGFENICTYHSLGQDWELISLSWKTTN